MKFLTTFLGLIGAFVKLLNVSCKPSTHALSIVLPKQSAASHLKAVCLLRSHRRNTSLRRIITDFCCLFCNIIRILRIPISKICFGALQLIPTRKTLQHGLILTVTQFFITYLAIKRQFWRFRIS